MILLAKIDPSNLMDKQIKLSAMYQEIVRNLVEVIDSPTDSSQLLQRPCRLYWGTAPTGKPHLGYLVPLIKLVNLHNLGLDVTILLADLHAMMDNLKSTSELIEHRTQFYQILLEIVLKHIQVSLFQDQGRDLSELKFVRGSSFQKTPEYMTDLLKLMSTITYKKAQHAGAEVVKQNKDPLLSSLAYPLMQMLDEEYLQADYELGGGDQRKIMMFARDNCELLGYKKRGYLMNPLIPGLTKTGKMSSSEPLSRIDFDDTDDIIITKIMRAYSVDGQLENNGLMAIIKYIIFEFYPNGFHVQRAKEYGGDVVYHNLIDLETDFVDKKMSSCDLKPVVAQLLINIITPIRQQLTNHLDLMAKAYPTN